MGQKSTNLFLYFFKFINNPEFLKKQFKDCPFFGRAVCENPRFCHKLLGSYYRFDKISKEKIKTLYDLEKQILNSHTSLNLNTPEFRILMQEKLKEFWSNEEIIEQIKEKDVDADSWLNYSEKKKNRKAIFIKFH